MRERRVSECVREGEREEEGSERGTRKEGERYLSRKTTPDDRMPDLTIQEMKDTVKDPRL